MDAAAAQDVNLKIKLKETNMSKKYPGVCFVGCGNIASRHSKIIRKAYKNISLSFFDTDQAKALEFKTKFNGTRSFPELAHVLDSPDVDIVYITTPHAFHAEIACEAAKNGKHIIIEKPVARNVAEYKKIAASVKKYGVRCTVAENYLYKGFIKKITDSINRGDIGKPLIVELNKHNRDTISGWRSDADLMGGGALLEGGVHWVNLLVSLAQSDPVSVFALKPEVDYSTNIPFEDTVVLSVKFKNGTVGKLLHSWRIPNRLKGVSLSKIYGTDGAITFESNGLFTSVAGNRKKKFFPDFTDFLGYKGMNKAFIEDYIEERPWNPGLERIEMELKLVEAAYRSLKSGKMEEIKSV